MKHEIESRIDFIADLSVKISDMIRDSIIIEEVINTHSKGVPDVLRRGLNEMMCYQRDQLRSLRGIIDTRTKEMRSLLEQQEQMDEMMDSNE